jgi:hypothetical protein
MHLSDVSQRKEPIEPLVRSVKLANITRWRLPQWVYIPHASLGATSRVANGVEYTREGPASSKNGRGNGETETRDQKSTKERNLVLGEVGVRALGCRRES